MTRAAMGTGAVPANSRSVLMANLDHPRWDAIAERCLACANCTLVCPTCFCTGTEVQSGFDGGASSAIRTWDSLLHRRVRPGRRRQLPAAPQGPLPAVAHPQVRDVVGPVRDLGLHRLRPLRRLVPGRDRRPRRAPRDRRRQRRRRSRRPCRATTSSRSRRSPRRRWSSRPATVVSVTPETADTATLRLATDDPRILAGKPGQFVMVGVPAFAIPPISISRFHPDGLELTIRAAGAATSFLTKLRRGATLALRGPLGRGWPVEDAYGRDVVIVAGGIGLAPLRPVIDAVLARPRPLPGRPDLPRRPDPARAAVRRGDRRARRERGRPRPRHRGPRRAGVARARRDRHPAVQDRPRDGRGRHGLHLRAGTDDGRRRRTCSATSASRASTPGSPSSGTWSAASACAATASSGSRFVCRDGPVFSVAELGGDLRREGL